MCCKLGQIIGRHICGQLSVVVERRTRESLSDGAAHTLQQSFVHTQLQQMLAGQNRQFRKRNYILPY